LTLNPDDDNVIAGYVPLAPDTEQSMGTDEQAKKRVGWPKGKPRGKPKAAPVDTFDRGALRTEEPSASACPGCGKEAVTALDLGMVRELVRSARDRLDGASPELRAHSSEADVLYLAARLDGYCSLTCWRDHQS
jgi:hypothetical protein